MIFHSRNRELSIHVLCQAVEGCGRISSINSRKRLIWRNLSVFVRTIFPSSVITPRSFKNGTKVLLLIYSVSSCHVKALPVGAAHFSDFFRLIEIFSFLAHKNRIFRLNSLDLHLPEIFHMTCQYFRCIFAVYVFMKRLRLRKLFLPET